MKVAILTDTHWGARAESKAFLDYFSRFHAEVFFPYLEQHGIKQIDHLGDLVDRRKYINYVVVQQMRTTFVDRLAPYQLTICVGNHDAPFRNNLEANAIRELLGNRPNVRIIEEPQFLPGGILMLPWICPANETMTKDAIAKAASNGSRIVMGHLELAGFLTQRGRVKEKGMDASMFAGFPLVLSGHYHHRNSLDNIHYLGSPYEITWADYNDQKGFHILDTETLELEFIPNPLRMHERLEFDGWKDMEVNFSNYQNKIVQVVVRHMDSRLDTFIRELENANPAMVQVVDEKLVKAIGDGDRESIGDIKDTLDMLMSSIHGVSSDSVDKVQLSELLANLYQEAVSRTREAA